MYICYSRNTGHRPSTQANCTACRIRPNKRKSFAASQIVARLTISIRFGVIYKFNVIFGKTTDKFNVIPRMKSHDFNSDDVVTRTMSMICHKASLSIIVTKKLQKLCQLQFDALKIFLIQPQLFPLLIIILHSNICRMSLCFNGKKSN